MRELKGNLFNVAVDAICITTNGYVKTDGCAVMGRGVARQASARWPELSKLLGRKLAAEGNHVFWLMGVKDAGINVVSFPVKQERWDSPAKLSLIRRSCGELVNLVNQMGWQAVALPWPGCGNGGLTWDSGADCVRDVVLYLLDERFTVVDLRTER